MAEAVDAAWIGIDVGKLHHHAVAVDVRETVLWSEQIRNDQAVIEQLITTAPDTANGFAGRWTHSASSAVRLIPREGANVASPDPLMPSRFNRRPAVSMIRRLLPARALSGTAPCTPSPARGPANPTSTPILV
ncbi:transposase [Nocardia sp. NBC_00881]|uniref:IS110 family transposase n=1 Tax=Nocardia sp. NBC_00881 TaxID=2975995 RepID=UPI00386F761C